MIGINWTSPWNYETVKELASSNAVDFCEILIDNFLVYNPEVILRCLPTQQCAFHIMNSNFLQRDPGELADYAIRIKKLIAAMKPIYVSDHIGLFKHDNRSFPFMQELSYRNCMRIFKERARMWGELLDSYIYYENFPSAAPETATTQIAFYGEIQNLLGGYLNILMDVSNAIVAEKNGCAQAREWECIARKTAHFHVGGYQQAGATGYFVDSHNCAVSGAALELLEEWDFLRGEDKTIVIERDYKINFPQWYDDVRRVRQALGYVV